ncbi:Uncharacterised protein [Mycobacterium tuberculosis]|nr:Uncharacterised protein [Mycobacterium tuberculosis]
MPLPISGRPVFARKNSLIGASSGEAAPPLTPAAPDPPAPPLPINQPPSPPLAPVPGAPLAPLPINGRPVFARKNSLIGSSSGDTAAASAAA